MVSFRVAAGSLEGIKGLTEEAIYEASPDVELDFTLGNGPVEIDHDIEGKYFRPRKRKTTANEFDRV